ncbi:MAG: hypothetical protein ACI9JN_002422 [Bacteroidia bacterium]|jgi:hypothetical protein
MELQNQPKLGLELTLKKSLVITTILAVLLSLGVFMYTNLSSTPDTFAGTQGTTTFTCYGPAGVGDNTTNRFCYDLDSLNYTDNDLVSSVTNIGGNGTAWSQTTTANQPSFETGADAMNGHPVLEFDGTNDYLKMADQSDLNTSTSTDRTYVVVIRTSSDIASRQVIYEEGGGTRGLNIYIYNSKLYVAGWNKANDGNDAPWVFKSVDSSISKNTEYIVTMVYDGSTNNTTSGKILGYLNGALMGTATGVGKLYSHGDDIGLGAMNGNTVFENGNGNGTGNYYQGDIATFIEYNYALDSAQRTILENGLSSKFDIAIQNDKYTSDANGYDHFVAGIGKSSADINACAASGGLIQLSNPTDLDAGEYLLFGCDNGAGGSTTDNPDSINNRWNRGIKFHETGDVGAVDVIFNLDQSDFTITEEDDLRLIIDTDGDGDMSNAQIVVGSYNSTTNAVTYTGVIVNNNATYSLGSTSSANALPVEFLYIKAKQDLDENVIDWATAMEENNSHFIIERTHDGASWETIGEVGGAGFSSNVIKYSYTDQNPYMDVNYYRIKQVDYDGKFDYSQVVMVNSLVQKADINLKLFPNPADNVVRVEWGKEEETGKIVLLGLTGNVVSEQLPGEHNALTLDLTTVKNGVYFIQFVGTTSTKTERLVVRH